jgi:hypothetical protein
VSAPLGYSTLGSTGTASSLQTPCTVCRALALTLKRRCC